MVLRQRVSYLMDLNRNSYFIELLILNCGESVYVQFYTNKMVIFTFIIKSKRSICFYVDPVEIGGVCSSTDPALPLIWDQLATITPRSIFFKTITYYNLFYYNISIPQQQHRSFFFNLNFIIFTFYKIFSTTITSLIPLFQHILKNYNKVLI